MTHTLHFSIHEVAPYINWLYFFHAWGFPARLGSIAEVHGCEACRLNWLSGFPPEEMDRAREAIRLFDDAQLLLRHADATYHTHALIGLFKANSEGDDVWIQQEGQPMLRLPFLRQQQPGGQGYCLCMSDFVRPFPNSFHPESSKVHDDPATVPFQTDRIGVFACCTDRAFEEEQATDDYQHFLHQTLADRLAEATAERMHEYVRKELWAFAPQEQFTIPQLFAEHYQGKRPAVGYPSMPDQSLNFMLDSLIDFSHIGISLTENGAMRPHASTSGIILSHPHATHFSIGKIGDDQLADYAQRRGFSVEQMRKFLT